MLTFVSGNVADGGEDISAVSCTALDAISVVDATLSSFRIDVEVLEVVVEVDGAGTEVSSKKRCMRGEDCCHIDLSLSAKWKGHT